MARGIEWSYRSRGSDGTTEEINRHHENKTKSIEKVRESAKG